AVAQCIRNRLDHARMGMPKNERPPGAHVIQVAVTVDVVEIWAFAAGDERRFATHGTKRAGRTVDAARDQPLGAGKRHTAAVAIRRHGIRLRHGSYYGLISRSFCAAWRAIAANSGTGSWA